MKTNNSFKIAGMFLIVAMIAVACVQPQSTTLPPTTEPTMIQPTNTPLVKVRFRVGWQPGGEYSPIYLAKARGYYEDEGLDVEILPGSGSPDNVKFLGTGAIDLGHVDAPVLVQSIERGVPIKSVGVYYYQNPIAVLSPEDKPLKTPQDLIGKKVGTAKGSSTTQGLQAFLEVNGIAPTDLEIVDIGFGVQPLLTGQVDALMGFSNTQPPDAEVNNFPVYVMMIADYGVQNYGLTIAASDTFIKNNPDQVSAFLRATIKGMVETAKDPQAAVDALVAAEPDVDPVRALIVLKLTIPLWEGSETAQHGYLWQTLEGWQKTVEVVTRVGLVVTPPEIDSIWTGEFLK